jgi:hypothetical protein
VAQDPRCARDLDAALAAAGLDPVHRYDQTWLPGEPTIYGVTIGVPRITPADLGPGPISVSYDLPRAACERWRTTPGAIPTVVTGTAP